MKKTIIGVKEKVKIIGEKKSKIIMARIDTGATKSSIDKNLAKKLGLGPVVKYKRIKTAHGTKKRALVLARVKLAGRIFKVYFSLADRKHMKYDVLIGRNVLRKGFLIDPSRRMK